MIKKYSFFCFLLLLISNAIWGQLIEIEKIEKPKFDASIKAKYEYATETKMSRFSVRNSRMGLSGNIIEPISYRVQVELSNQGEFQILDLCAKIRPIPNLEILFGQTSIPLFNSYIITPSQLMFANRAFIGKYFTGTRDIGVTTSYKINYRDIPFELNLGVFNGSTINDPIWTDKLSRAARLIIGDMDGWRSSFKYYRYPLSNEKDYTFWGADLRFGKDNYKIETEIMNRHNRFTDTDRLSIYLQGAYAFPLNNKGAIKDITPAIRWDAIGENINKSKFDASRLTFGIAFGFSPKPFGSLIRFDYEYYFVDNPIAEFDRYPEMDSNKFTIEILLIF